MTDDGSFYRPCDSIEQFHEDTHFVRVLIGGRGAGKTVGECMEAIRHGWQNAGAKIIFLRQTETSLRDSVIETLNWLFSQLDPELYEEREDSLFRMWDNGITIRIPSAQAAYRYREAKPRLKTKQERKAWLETEGDKWCSRIENRGLPSNKVAENKLKGFECSMLCLVEGDQIAKDDFMLSFACLRWKGADPKTCNENGFIEDRGIILDANPPAPDHWIAQLEEEEEKKPEGQRRMRFWHLTTDENAHNLPPNYIEDTIMLPYANNPSMIERMRWGKYADAFSGNPVFYNFRTGYHVGHDRPWPTGAALVRGWDFGVSNCVIYSAYFTRNSAPKGQTPKIVEYWHCLAEQYLEESDTDRQAKICIERTKEEFGLCFDTQYCCGILDFCDPAGANRNYSTEKTESCVAILNTHKIYPSSRLWNRSIAVGLTIMNRMLMLTDDEGEHIFMIDKEGCPLLYKAFAGGYRYPGDDEGQKKDEPLKGLVYQKFDYSHLVDPLRYSIMNCFRLARSEYAESKGVPSFHKRKNPNRELSYY